MNLFISLIYAPLVFFALRHFDIKNVSIIIFIISAIWLIFLIKNKKKEDLIFPFLYLGVSSITFFLEDFLILKILPFLITLVITAIMVISYLKKESIILYFAKKITKKEFSKKEQEYIHNCTLYWILLSIVNLCIHYYAFIGENLNFWMFYSSIGGYLLLAFAGLVQYIHTKYIFKKNLKEDSSTKDIIFVNPPYENISKDHNCIKHISNSSPSLGLLHLAAQVRKDGYNCSIIEADLEAYTPDEVAQLLIEQKPELVGITLFTVGVHNAVIIAKKVKESLPQTKILVGGPHISSMGYETMQRFLCFDIAVMHEGEITLSKLIPALKTNSSLNDIEGIIYKDENDNLIRTANRNIQIELDDLPLPAWEILPNFPKAYPLTIFDYPKGLTATFSASRGCPFKCEFCDTSTFGAKIRYYSPKKVFEMMQHLQSRYNVTHLQFVDDLFVANRKRILELCDLIIENNFKMTWSCTARVDTISLKILKKMKEAGCWEISYGLESGSDIMLDNMRKSIKVEQSTNAVNWTHEAGIRCKGLLMLGYPGETEETIEQTKEFIKSIPLTTMNLSKFTPYPGSPIYIKLYGKAIRDEDWDRMNGMNFIYEPEQVSMQKLNSEYKSILEGFYRRPKIMNHYIKMAFISPIHLIRLIKFGLCNFVSKYRTKEI